MVETQDENIEEHPFEKKTGVRKYRSSVQILAMVCEIQHRAILLLARDAEVDISELNNAVRAALSLVHNRGR